MTLLQQTVSHRPLRMQPARAEPVDAYTLIGRWGALFETIVAGEGGKARKRFFFKKKQQKALVSAVIDGRTTCVNSTA